MGHFCFFKLTLEYDFYLVECQIKSNKLSIKLDKDMNQNEINLFN